MTLLAPKDRIVIQVEMDKKNWWTFAGGTRLRLERNWNNLNMRHVNPVNAVVIAGEGLQPGVEILVHHNSVQKTWEIHNYRPLSGERTSAQIKYFSIPSEMTYAWWNGLDWMPCVGFAFGLRVYRPYGGLLTGIMSKQIPDTLYVTTGHLQGEIVHTLKACDYTIIFQDKNDQEGNIIRFRHWDDDMPHLREEVICLRHDLKEAFQQGKLLIGHTATKAMTIHEYDHSQAERADRTTSR